MAENNKRKAVYDPEADKRWREKNRERANYTSARSAARSFIRTKAQPDDLVELEEMIAVRRAELMAED